MNQQKSNKWKRHKQTALIGVQFTSTASDSGHRIRTINPPVHNSQYGNSFALPWRKFSQFNRKKKTRTDIFRYFHGGKTHAVKARGERKRDRQREKEITRITRKRCIIRIFQQIYEEDFFFATSREP